MNSPTILLVDDDRAFAPLVEEYLTAKGLRVRLVFNGFEALDSFRADRPDLCVLDVRMPLKDGFTLAEEIRQYDPNMPIIFLTGQTEKEHRIKGLTLGADDYVTKPFSMEELSLRIQNILRRVGIQRAAPKSKAVFPIARFSFDADARTLTENGPPTMKLTAIEANLLRMFCENENGVVERELALKRIWNDEAQLHGRSLNTYVSKLRGYLASDERIEFLNIHGVGYKMVVKG